MELNRLALKRDCEEMLSFEKQRQSRVKKSREAE